MGSELSSEESSVRSESESDMKDDRLMRLERTVSVVEPSAS